MHGVAHIAMRKIGDAHERCNVISFQELSTKALDNPLDWDPITNFVQSHDQSIE